MAFYTTIHLRNVPIGKDAEYAAWFHSVHRADLARPRSLKGPVRHEVTPEQIMQDIPPPWRYVSSFWPGGVASCDDLSVLRQ